MPQIIGANVSWCINHTHRTKNESKFVLVRGKFGVFIICGVQAAEKLRSFLEIFSTPVAEFGIITAMTRRRDFQGDYLGFFDNKIPWKL
jgi:hypothetical protein